MRRLTSLINIKYPILQGGMAWVATAPLAAAVSEAGGLGIIGAGNASAEWVRQEIHRLRELTAKPFGVNVLLLSPEVEAVMKVVTEERVPVVTTGAGSPGLYMAALKAAGCIVIPVVASLAMARRLERQGADALIAEGSEAGGHIGEVGTLTLVPQIVDAVGIPVVAAGGIADGRGMAAAFVLGAEGVQLGTRFICSTECEAHINYKQAIVNASERDAVVCGTSIGHPVRALKNNLTRELAELEKSGASFAELSALGSGRLRLAFSTGDMENGSAMAGQSAGLIKDILPVGEIISALIAETEKIFGRDIWTS
ncbi:MAG: enoyl-[acyl-carrier-protein] reductase FabK [Firmicutes bacterium]|nr:enoyl-[acyl-carrier-protein] reductase FabK [Dethiobacter sp.]MBS3888416.1 enoyl-[acyl-carrier-protein] reductase FabK [Bacillota bacterium]